jgi:hypothetical protein
MSTIVAICLGGLEEEVIADIRKFTSSEVLFQTFSELKPAKNGIEINGKYLNTGECGCGKIILSNVSNFDFIHRVRSVQHWLVYLGDSLHVPKDLCSGIPHIQKLVADQMDLIDALQTWKKCLSPSKYLKYDILATSDASEEDVKNRWSPKFCVRCIRDGEHEYSSIDVARKIGESILMRCPSWSVDLCSMDFEVIALLMGDSIVIGMNILTDSPPFLKSKIPGEIRAPVVPSGLTSGLRPSTAYLLVQLARPQPGDLLVDAMCGCGATFVEAAFSHGCISIGGDVEKGLYATLKKSLDLTRSMSEGRAVAEVLLVVCLYFMLEIAKTCCVAWL